MRRVTVVLLVLVGTVACDALSRVDMTIDIPAGVQPERSIDDIIERVRFFDEEGQRILGRELAPFRVVSITFQTLGSPPYVFRLSDGTPDPHGRGIGGDWIVEAEGTFVRGVDPLSADQPTNAEAGLARRGYFGLNDRMDLSNVSSLLFECYGPYDPSFYDGKCAP